MMKNSVSNAKVFWEIKDFCFIGRVLEVHFFLTYQRQEKLWLSVTEGLA